MVDMWVRGLSDVLPSPTEVIGALPSQGEQSRPKHDMTEGIITLADDKRPGATLLIGIS